MLDQIIYTRCYPHRNLMEDGKVELDEGFGIFSFTESVSHLYPDEKELLSSCLQFPNGGAESLPENLFASYEYFPFSDGTAVIIHAQTKPCCTEKRRNGFSHRDGNFIKQAFIGEIQCYPFEWFGNSQWNAQFCSDNDFYMDCIENPVPPYLPQVQDVTPAEHKSPEWMRKKEEIRNFIAAGRQECLKEAACFVFQQFRVSEEERKVLLIKDTPQNVEKWITAISMGLPAEMAKQISFSTNMTNLSNAIESKLFFYTSQDGSFSKFRNGSSNLRRPYYLIVGYHPEDRNCNVRKLADSNFEVLDGISMQFSFSPDNSEIQKEYYQELVNFGEDMEDFSNVILPELDVSVPDDRIPELYAAYHYLMTEQDSGRRPQYDRTLISLKQFGITSNQIINQYLFRKVSQNYPDFWKEDAQNQYALLNFCWNLGGDKNLKYDIAEQMILKLQTPLNAEPINCARLQAFWKEFRMYAPAELKKLVLDNLFESSEAIQEYSRKLKNEKITAVELMFSVFYEMLKINRMLTREFTEDTEKYCFLLRLLVMAAKNKTTLERIFYELECPDFLMHRIIMDGAKILHHTADSELLMIWWDCALAASGCDVTELCRKLRNDNMMTPELLEQLIINRILRSGSCPPELFSTLLNCRQEEDTGKSIFCEWIEYTRKKQNFQEFVNIIYYIRKFRFPLETQKDLLVQADSALLRSEDAGYACLNEIETWAKSIKCISQDAVLLRAKNQLTQKHLTEKEFCDTLNHVARAHTPFFREFIEWELFSDIMEKALKYRNPDIYMALLMLFDFDENDRIIQKYVTTCLRAILDSGRTRSQQLSLMLDICGLYNTSVKVSSYDKLQITAAQKVIEKSFKSLLPEYYKSGMEDTLKHLNKEDITAKAELLSVIHEKIPESQNKKKTFLSIFNKNK